MKEMKKVLTTDEIKVLIDNDKISDKKQFARAGERYYDGDHDIKKYRLFYYNADGKLCEDKTRSNVKIPHPFFTELVDQCTQYILSGDRIVIADDTKLQDYMDKYFNNNDEFMAELSDCITDMQVKGWAYMYAYKNTRDKMAFAAADALDVIEVREKDADDGCKYTIYHYIERIDKGRKIIKRIQVWDEKETWFYTQVNDGELQLDESQHVNPRPHVLYTEGNKKGETYFDGFGYIPFIRLDNNKKQISSLKPVKPLIDDYDLMASSLSNNLIDFDAPIYAIKGFEGDNLDELQTNLKTKKIVGLGEEGGIDIKTVDVPYQARQAKLELDEKNIYRFGMGLNTAGLKDTSATTNIAIKAAYSLLDLKANKVEKNIKKMLRKLVEIVVDEINNADGTAYQVEDVRFEFTHNLMSNVQENAQIKLTEAQTKQAEINTILSVANVLDDETVVKSICDWLDIDYEEIKDKLPAKEEDDTKKAQDLLKEVNVETGGEK
jgi:SPP1 family phage portal protein